MTRRRKVLVIRNAYDQDCGGAEQYALNLCIELINQGFDPVLMTRVPGLISKAAVARVPVLRGRWHRTQEWGKHYFIRFPLMVLWYLYIIVRYRFDVIHPQGRDDFIFASVAGGILSRRVIWTDHADLKYILDLSVHPFPHLRTWTIWAARFAHKIICVSNAERDKIASHAPKSLVDKLVVVHNGVAITAPTRAPERPTSPLVVANSRLVQDKGIAELIEMTSRVKQQPYLWIVGGFSGNDEKYQQMANKFGVADRVKLWGYVDHPNDYVAAADVFVHASYHEAFSLAVVEAAMLGKPIVATNVGGAPEIIDDNHSGILVPPMDVDALVKAVEYLLDNPEVAEKYSCAIEKRARAEFVFSTIVKERVIPLYT